MLSELVNAPLKVVDLTQKSFKVLPFESDFTCDHFVNAGPQRRNLLVEVFKGRILQAILVYRDFAQGRRHLFWLAALVVRAGDVGLWF